MPSNTDAPGGWRSADTDFSKFFAELRLPHGANMESLVAAQRRNLEVLAAANKVAMEGAQAVARRHMEIMQASLADLTETVGSLASPTAPQEKAAKSAELIKRSYERAVANMKELSDLIQKSNGEAMEMLNKRFAEAMDEVKRLVADGGHR